MAKYPGDDGRYNEPDSKRETREVLEGKETKAKVHYRPQTEDTKETCFDCLNYCQVGKPEGDCSKVAGLVRADWVCDLWDERQDNGGDNDNDAPQVAVNINFNLGQGLSDTA